ncbi:MAG: hypothetical protein V1847_01400 [Candidatus Diapherotrites archaeon]
MATPVRLPALPPEQRKHTTFRHTLKRGVQAVKQSFKRRKTLNEYFKSDMALVLKKYKVPAFDNLSQDVRVTFTTYQNTLRRLYEKHDILQRQDVRLGQLKEIGRLTEVQYYAARERLIKEQQQNNNLIDGEVLRFRAKYSDEHAKRL